MDLLKNKKIMTLSEKKQKLSEIKAEFERGMFSNGKVENIGSIFFLYHTGACVLRDVVYYQSIRHKLPFETLCMTSSYFIGSKEHAQALQEAYGGKLYPTEYCHFAENARELYAWEGPKRQEQMENNHFGKEVTPLDLDEIKTIIF